MHTPSLSAKTLILVSVLVIPVLAWAASGSDAEYRSCVRLHMNNRENRIIEATVLYHTNWQTAIQNRRSRLFDAWNVETDRDRDNIIREIERDATNNMRENDKFYRDVSRVIVNDYRNAERDCKNNLRDRQRERNKVPVGRRCFNSGECFAPLGACTTDLGDCRQTCQPGSSPCVQVCAGVCYLK